MKRFSPRTDCYSVRLCARTLYFAAVLFIITGSVIPADDIPSTGFSDTVLHFVAYAMTGVLGILGFEHRVTQRNAVRLLMALGAVLEAVQYFLPSRYFELADILANVAGAAFAVLLNRIHTIAFKREF